MNRTILGILIFACISCSQSPTIMLPKEIQPTITEFPVSSSVRALAGIDSLSAWFGGHNGQYGFTNDGGKTWKIDSLWHDGRYPHFRSIAVTSKAVFLLSIESPALLYKSADLGESWDLVYTDSDSLAFYDAMAFANDDVGFAMGDPQEGCLTVIKTTDGGDSWAKIPCDRLPPTVEGEAAFAASNSNISIAGNNVWIVSGGVKARVFHSPDLGESWDVYQSPLVEGGTMTGIFSSAFYDENRGVIFGGDWEKMEVNTKNKATTSDGGKTWELLADGGGPGYRSHVQYLPGSDAKGMIAVGIPGISYSGDGGKTWQSVNDESYYTVQVVDGHHAWLAGKERVALMRF